MKTDELREAYLSFFESKGCVRRPSDVLVPKEDKTVLFTPAGMNQFKNQFLGIGKLEFTRAATCQKCLRTGDIGNVGMTAYHHTFFEMLGNFSFGDYFKREAILWGWEFLTQKKWLGIDPERLSVTVYLDDDEAYDIWHKEVGLPPERIRRDDEYENFWPAGAPSEGPDGVCGPCSEIYFHPGNGKKEVEIWNLVFTQFNRVGPPPDNLRPLPKKNIDTGMGLERCASVLQGVESNFEIDILRPLCLAAAETVGIKYDFHASEGRPIRRIADHVRACTFAIHEGVQPGPKEAGYVIRQLLRRAVLEGYLLGRHEPFLHRLVPRVVELMRRPYPELAETTGSVQELIRGEESQFIEAIERGLPKFERAVERGRATGRISGEDAFELHATDGFFIEMTESMAARRNLAVDVKRFQELMEKHQKDSGRGAFLDAVMAEGPLDAIRKTQGGTEFLGYDTTEAQGKIVGIIAEKQLVDELTEVGHELPVAVVLDRTPFYGEAGGQVGDVGVLTGEGVEFQVLDTQRDGELILHVGHLKRGRLQVAMALTARVEADRRAGIRRAHSATHLLHHALHETIGKGATQRGSKVERDELRFDFAHGRPLTPEEILRVEDIVNSRIAEGAAVGTKLMDVDEARKTGAMALFGEKYPDLVRVVRMGDFSVELCGGTHLTSTGQVGLFKIVGEEGVAKGVRRITALTGPRALQEMRETENLLKETAQLLRTPQPEEIPRRIQQLQDEIRDLKRELAAQTKQSLAGVIDELIAGAQSVGETRIVTYSAPELKRDAMRDLVDQLRSKLGSVAILLGAVEDGKVALTAAVSKDLLARGVKANEAIRVAAKVVGGGGGGRPDMAEAGGKLPDKLPDALAEGAKFYRSQLGA